ncbi:hypothetical protein ACTI_51840 [Actinoplanes sp. OR16]|uniref:hypothetical protein n=1 Tax=Actinoplanes sp. OR16 TaxID=946334 RepID=UPI000F6B3C52|nr:hypothetical protein [Actinoplanes sp. OR16]BBH68499.1 hypothetical protein ACTI_51840 [Actinoplanes sp. OR16]
MSAFPALIERLETEVLVDHGSFDLIDDSGEQDAPAGGDWLSPGLPGGGWLSAGRNMITVVSASTRHHVAAVTVEAWEAQPAPAPGWADMTETSVILDSGFLEINPLVDGEDADDITVGGAGAYRVRAYVTGRAELQAATPPPDVELHGVERYLLQIWPAP